MSISALWVALLLCLVAFKSGRGLPSSIRIGGLFEYEYHSQELVFKYAVEKINARRDLLPFTKLTYDIEQVPGDDSFTASKRVCRQVREGVAAIFGPMSTISATHVQSICDALELPHIETRWDFREIPDFYAINLYPYYKTLAKAYMDLITHWQWRSFTILYQSNEGLIRLEELLRAPSEFKVQVTVRRLEPSTDGDFRPILKEVKKRGESKIIIDCDVDLVGKILSQAQSINMMTQYYHYLVTTLDLGLVNLDDFKYGGTNITSYRLVNPDSRHVKEVLRDWASMLKYQSISKPESPKGFRNSTFKPTIGTETALIYDAVHLFAKALDEVSRAQNIETTPMSCNKAKGWEHGTSLLNYLKMTQIDGLSGHVRYDSQGRRSEFSLELNELTLEGLETIGYWHPKRGINVTKDYTKEIAKVADSLKNQTLVVTTIMEDPYMMRINDSSLVGNARFKGYCVDLLHEIAQILQFNYTIKEVDDGKYGAPEGPNGEWSGMVRELMDRKADLAVASLTISYVREQEIDFTKPFMNLGISILFKRPEKKTPSLWSFLSPLSFDIWIYMAAAYLCVSFMLFILGRFSPYEWYNPHPCNDNSDVVENQFTLLNSLWFTIGSLMQQGSEVAPRSNSTRLVSAIWWFFTLIMISSYTANLAAFLTVERMTSPIENADDLAKQSKIKYGTIYGGSTMTFFKSSKIPTYERMWNSMSSWSDVFVNSTKVGIEKVKASDYAYLLESTMNDYITQRDCDLMQVGGLLDSKGYGIGTPRDSPYRDLISNAILKLQEDQILQMMYNKWWKKEGAQQCDVEDKNKKDANALAIDNVGGVFVVLVIGLILSLFVAIGEFYYKVNKEAGPDPGKPMCVEMMDELRFAMTCCGSDTKIVKRRDHHRSQDFYLEGNGTTFLPLSSMGKPKKESMA